jgi:AcrR family transcriptional regulator
MTQRRLSLEERKAQILEAARTLFARNGYDKVTLDDIAEQVGISRPRIVQIFGSKEKIYLAIAESAYESHPMDRDLAEPMARKDDFEVFYAFAEHILRHTSKQEETEIFKILLYARLREDRFHRIHFQEKDTLMISRLADYVQERVEEGAFQAMDPRVITYSYQAMVTSLAMYKGIFKKMDFVTVDELSKVCASIFLEGITSKDDDSPGD